MINIDSFWREVFPNFENFEIFYMFFDVISVMVLIRLIMNAPEVMLGLRKKL